MSKSDKMNYGNLSSDVLIKKITAIYKQIDIVELFIKQNNINYEFKKIDELKTDMIREDLEKACDFIVSYHNKLKLEQNKINKLLEEKKKLELEKEKEKLNNTNNEEEEYYENEKKEYPIITNLEELKRSFFSPDNEEYRPFETIIIENEFKYYQVKYKYSSDMYKKPEYMALNLNNGFVQRFDEYKKYLFSCFRCIKNNDNYEYCSFWLFNSTENINKVFENDIDDFEFTEIKLTEFINYFKKMNENNENLINKKYLH